MSSNNNKSSSYAACLSEHEKHDDDDDDNDGDDGNYDVLPSSREDDNEEGEHIVSSSVKVSSQHSSSNGDISSNDKVSSQTDETNDQRQPPSSSQSSFAVQLMNMLISETAAGGNSVRWLPTGNGFEIRNQLIFTSQCLPRYFKSTAPAVFTSFLRRLYRWGFKSEERAAAGSGQYVFNSEVFHRDNNKYLHMKALPRSKPKTQETMTNSDDIVSSLQHSDKGDSTHAAVSSSSQQILDSKKSHETNQDGKIRADTSSLDRHRSERYNNSIVSSSSQVANPHLETIPPQQQLTPQNRLLVEQLVNAMRSQTGALSTQTSGMLSSIAASQLNNPIQQQIPPTQAALIHYLLSSQQGISILPRIQQQAVSASFANTALQQHQMHQASSNHQVLLQAAQLLLQQHGVSVFRQESTNSNDDTTTTTSDAISSSNGNRGSSTRASSSLTSNNDEDNINTSSNEDSQGLNASTSNRKRERSPSPDN